MRVALSLGWGLCLNKKQKVYRVQVGVTLAPWPQEVTGSCFFNLLHLTAKVDYIFEPWAQINSSLCTVLLLGCFITGTGKQTITMSSQYMIVEHAHYGAHSKAAAGWIFTLLIAAIASVLAIKQAVFWDLLMYHLTKASPTKPRITYFPSSF